MAALRLIRTAALTLLLGSSSVASAQELLPLPGYRIDAWTQQDGLPPGAIWALAQDDDGFLWIGSDAGLIRFDGARFRRWEELGGAELPTGSVRAITVGRDGAMWVAFEQPVIARIQGRTVSRYGQEGGIAPDSRVLALREDSAGVVWAGTTQALLRFSGSGFIAEHTGPSPIAALALNSKGHIVAITDTGVMARVGGNGPFEPLASITGGVQSAAIDSWNRVWLTARDIGYRALHPVDGARRALRGKGYDLLPDSKGNLWIATYGQGVWHVRLTEAGDQGSVQSLTDAQGLSNNVVYTLLEDTNGSIWAGTTAGLNRIAPQRMAQIQDLGVVTGLEVTGQTTVWANTPDGLTRFSLRGSEWQRLEQDPIPVRPEAMHADPAGVLWVASAAGLERLVQSAAGVRRERVSSRLRTIQSITSAPDGTVWVFDGTHGLFQWAAGRLTAFALPASIPASRISSIFADSARRLWFALRGQPALIGMTAEGQVQEYGPAVGYKAGYPRMFFQDQSGALWIAGSLGLSRLEDGQFATIERDAALPLDSPTGIVEDEDGRLWIATAGGITRMDKAEFATVVAGRRDGLSLAALSAADGIAGTTGWIGQPNAVKSGDGRLWFLTVTGMTMVNPRLIVDSVPRAPVRIEVVSIDDRPEFAAAAHKVPPNTTRIGIEYTAPTLSAAEQPRFRYRLEGLDTDWINAGRLRTATYTNLPPRTYRFHVQMQAMDGAWGPPATWDFSVQAAFYQTFWFLGLSLITGGVIVWSAWRLRVAQVRRQLAMVHGERARLSREIHDTLLQSLVGVALQCDSLAKAPDHESASKGLVSLRRQVEGYVRECRQSLWNLRSPILDSLDLPSALRDIAQRLTGPSGVAADVRASGTIRRSPGRIDEQLLRIGQEALTNAVRHARAQTVIVRIDYTDTSVMLEVRDDGCGFQPNDPTHENSGHWGLVGMQERAKAVNGSFSIVSSPTTGTAVTVAVPVRHSEAAVPAQEEPSHDASHGQRAGRQPAA